MQSGKPSFINISSIKAILNSLLGSTVDTQLLQPIENLFLVKQISLSAIYPSSEHQKLFIIQDILVEIITSTLIDIRERFHIDTVKDESSPNAKISIKRDSSSNSTELLSWSILYYVYVVSDLGLHTDDIAQCVGLADRTVRRYRDQAIIKLTKKLWSRELGARQEFHYKRIENRIHFVDANNYIRRVPMLDNIVNGIQKNKYGVTYIYGDVGTGKTVLVKQCVAEILNFIDIDDVIWVNNPNSVTDIFEYFCFYYEISDSQDLKELFNALDIIIVIDNFNVLIHESNTVSNLLEHLTGSILFITSQIYHPAISIQSSTSTYLTNFTHAEVHILLEHIGIPYVPEISSILNTKNSYNPRLIHNMVMYYKERGFLNDQINTVKILDCSIRKLLIFIPDAEPISVVDFNQLVQIFGAEQSQIDFLIESQIVIKQQGVIYLKFQSIQLKQFVDISAVVAESMSSLTRLSEPWLVVTHIIDSFQNILTESVFYDLIAMYWRNCMSNGNKSKWQQILSNATSVLNPVLIGLMKAFSLRLTNDLEASKLLLEELVSEAGMHGEFELQTEVIFEQAKIEHLQGHYTESLALISYLYQSLSNYLSPALIKRMTLERVQILLETGNVEIALVVLGDYDDVDALLLKAEAEYILEHYDGCVEICDNLIQRIRSNLQLVVLHNLLGRCYQHQNLQNAIANFDLAVQYSNTSANLRYLGRSLINLAVALLANEDLEIAIEKLELAEKICKATEDNVGLKTIRHNLAYIRRLLSTLH